MQPRKIYLARHRSQNRRIPLWKRAGSGRRSDDGGISIDTPVPDTPLRKQARSHREMCLPVTIAMRQLVTRQKTTRFIPGNGTTLSTLIDPDQNPTRN
ncbi:hypothetical protein [Pseudomonas sp. 3296]|uniref:hypothetical protein n=1 Tax=Pseudomonas sp. 3296 TaxID=2817753 RepID=UPI0038620E89